VNAIKGYEGLVVESSDIFHASDGFPMAECFLKGRSS